MTDKILEALQVIHRDLDGIFIVLFFSAIVQACGSCK